MGVDRGKIGVGNVQKYNMGAIVSVNRGAKGVGDGGDV